MKLCLSVFIFVLLGVALIECQKPTTPKMFELVSTFKLNWYKAYHHCMSNGMHLASVLSEEENIRLKKQINDTTLFDNFWLSGTKLGNEPFFYWMGDVKPMNGFTNWKNDPNRNGYSQPCVHMVTNNGDAMHWDVGNCDGANYFVCEKK